MASLKVETGIAHPVGLLNVRTDMFPDRKEAPAYFGIFYFDPTENTVSANKTEVFLSPVRAGILGKLCGDPSATHVLGWREVGRLRRDLEQVGLDGETIIQTVRNAGYRLNDPLHKENEGQLFNHPLFEFYSDKREIKVGKDFISLTAVESVILKVLMENVNKVVPWKLLSEDFQVDYYMQRAISVHMTRLRTKIEHGRDIKDPIIVSVMKRGYMLYDLSKLSEKERDIIRRGYSARKST